MKDGINPPAHDPMGGRTGGIGNMITSNILPMTSWGVGQDDNRNNKINFLYCKVPQVAGAGSQGTEPRSMIWDGSLTDRIRKKKSEDESNLPPMTPWGVGREE